MSSFLNDLPCRNPQSFTKIRTVGAVCQSSVRPTYSAKLDANVKEFINDPMPLLIHDLSRLKKNKSKKRSTPDDHDESEVPSTSTEQKKPCKANRINQISTNVGQQQLSNSIEYDEEFS